MRRDKEEREYREKGRERRRDTGEDKEESVGARRNRNRGGHLLPSSNITFICLIKLAPKVMSEVSLSYTLDAYLPSPTESRY
jgi:hypothetical protein